MVVATLMLYDQASELISLHTKLVQLNELIRKTWLVRGKLIADQSPNGQACTYSKQAFRISQEENELPGVLQALQTIEHEIHETRESLCQ